MNYSQEHIGKCAGCPKMEGCKALNISFELRVHFCMDLDKYRPKLDTILSRCSPEIRAMFADDPFTGFMANSKKDLSKHYTPEAIEAGKCRYDRRRKPIAYLSRDAKMSLIRRVCAN